MIVNDALTPHLPREAAQDGSEEALDSAFLGAEVADHLRASMLTQEATGESRCQAMNSKGKPCGSGVAEGARFCFAHDPERAAEVAEARRLGGMNSRPKPSPAPPADLSTVDSRRATLERVMDDLRSGSIGINLGKTLIFAVHVGHELAKESELIEKLKVLEATLAAQEQQTEVWSWHTAPPQFAAPRVLEGDPVP
jgi:hypothetical protein